MRDGIKIISLFGRERYDEKFAGFPVIYEENLFLECRCHEVCINVPVARADLPNIFEDTVLRLLGLFGCTIKEISERSCLEEDFVNSICLALRQRGFVDDNNITTDVGKDYLKQTALAGSVEEKVVRVLFLPDIGVLLDPILHDFYSDADYDGYIDGGMVKMLIDAQDAGKSETRSEVAYDRQKIPKEKAA